MSPASAIPAGAQQAAEEVAPWVAKLARVGFVAKALLYITVGALAIGAARPTGSRGAMGALLAAPFGRVLLYVVAAGLFGYAVWRLIEAIMNPEGERGWKGAATRVRSAGIAVIHFGLCYSAVRIAIGHAGAAQEGAQSQHWTARALATPGGEVALYAVALGVAGYGLYQLYRAWRAKLSKHLSLGQLSFRARRWVIGTSRFGIAARGVVLVVTGGLVAKAVRERDPSEAAGPAKSLRELFELGRIPFVIIAVGLIAYGVYQVINARYRRIRVA
jgi:hypothetical protein